jgi:hypothetical protein
MEVVMLARVSWLVPLALAAAALPAPAQEFPLAPLIARLPGGTRALAMANADMGGRESDVLFYNPAQIAVARGANASAEFYTHGDLLAGFSTVLDLDGGRLGVGVQSLTFSSASQIYASPGTLGSDAPLNSSGLVIAGGYARAVHGVRAGANVKVLQQQIGSVRDTRGSLDVGLAYDVWSGTAGLSVQNIGPALRAFNGTVSQPTRASVGFTSGRYEAGPIELTGAGTASVLRGRSFVAGAGGEAAFHWRDGDAVAVQAGVRRAGEGEGPWTAGASFGAGRVTLAYAYESRDGRPGAHRVGVAIR